MQATDRQAHAVWEGDLLGGKGEVELVSSSAGRFPVTWASRVEQPAGRTSPEELVAAAHASCYAMAFSNVLAKAGNTAERLHVTATVTVGPKQGGGIEVTSSRLEVTGQVHLEVRHAENLEGYGPNLVHRPSEITSTAPSTTLMAVCSSMA